MGSKSWQDWFERLRQAFSTVGSVTWDAVSKTGSDLADLQIKRHNDLQAIQGGTSGNNYHLTADEYTGAAQSNIDASKLLGNTWASPEAIGTGTAAAGTFTDLTSTGNTVLGNATTDTTKVSGQLIVAKDSGIGIKVDTTSPDFGWVDLLGAINTRPAAGGGASSAPDFVAYRGNLYAFRFGTTAPNNHIHEAFIEYHIPHDWVPGVVGEGRKAYVHVHWSQTTVDTGGTAGVPGVAKWYFDISYADGHGTAGGSADPFIAPITVSVTQQGSTTQYGHMIAEVEFANDGGTGGLLNYNTIQVDGLLLIRVYRDPTDVADTLNQDTFVHFVDIHHQSTGRPTKNRAPNFYS
jgi:hypothetical protein